MQRRSRQILAVVLTWAFLTSFAPAPLWAQDQNVTLEQAIQTAKELFPVTGQYPQFISEFSQSPQSSTWNLEWESEEPEQGRLQVRIDACSGEVVNVYHWVPDTPERPSTALTTAEAQAIADTWLKRLLPEKSSQFKPVSGPAIVPLATKGYSAIEVRYQRYAHGLPVQGDGVYLEINPRTRSISHYSLNWLDRSLPDPARVISSEQAVRVFQAENMLQKQYFQSFRWIKPDQEDQEPVRLIYTIDHPSGGSIDALTGRPLQLNESQWQDMAFDQAAKEAGMGGSGMPSPRLTPQEIAELEKNSQIISQQEAAARVKEWMDIPAQAILENAHLSRDGQDRSTRMWNLRWTKPASAQDDGAQYLWARVDASTGRIYAFSQHQDQPAAEGTMTRDEAAAVASRFIAKIEPSLADKIKLSEPESSPPPRPLTEEKLPAEWSLCFVRQVDGIPFPAEGIRVTVSSDRQKVVGYDLTWSEQKLPPAAQAISAAEAYRTYLQLAPMTLCYTPIDSRGGTPSFALVYKPLPPQERREFALLDALTREALNGVGTPLHKKPAVQTFTDIAGHFAAAEINRIGQAGLMAEYSPQFKPEEGVTQVVFLRAMLGAWEGVAFIEDLDDQRVIDESLERGWIKAKVDAKDPLSRRFMTQTVIRAMGLDQAARYGAIYKNPFPDDPTVDESMVGYAALAQAMGWLRPGPQFNGSETVTRGEAAFTLVKSFKS